MSIHVYLMEEAVQQLPGFTIKPQRGQDGQKWNEYELPNVKLFRDQERWYFTLSELAQPMPTAVADIIEGVSFHTWIPESPSREAGIYRHESAEAELDLDRVAGMPRIKVRILAEKMVDLIELYHRIRVGSIRPAESYEGKQSGMSRAALEAELKRMQQIGNGNLESLKADLRGLCRELESDWPFCAKATARDKISKILERHASSGGTTSLSVVEEQGSP